MRKPSDLVQGTLDLLLVENSRRQVSDRSCWITAAFLVVMIGIVRGWGGAAGGAKAMQSLLFHAPPFDPVTYASVSEMLAVVALAACWMPVRRAMRVDPMVALRDE